MISQITNTAVRGSYMNNVGDGKEPKQGVSTNITKQGDTSRIEQLKSDVESGTYKVDLQALSQKIAEELL